MTTPRTRILTVPTILGPLYVQDAGPADGAVALLSLNELCTMTYKAYALGTPKPILPEDIEESRRPMAENRPRGNAGGRVGMMSRWRYYTSLVAASTRAPKP